MDTGDRGRIRTFDRLLRRQMLYPAELRDPLCGCKDTNVNGCKKYFFKFLTILALRASNRQHLF